MSPDDHVISVPGRMSKEVCKLLILGDEGVGKTTLLKRLEKGRFVPNVTATIASEALLLRVGLTSLNIT